MPEHVTTPRIRRHVSDRFTRWSARLVCVARRICRSGRDAGMATAEYAIATLAACGFAGLLVAILSGGQVRGLLLGIIRRALAIG